MCLEINKPGILVRSFVMLSILTLFTLQCEAKEEQPPQIGNYSLPGSQQPGPLIGFGENIIDKNQAQLYLFADNYVGRNKKQYTDIMPIFIYGITDALSLFINAPYAARYQEEQQKSSGFEDDYVQLEYAFYTKSTSRYYDQATIVGNVTIPTGSIQKSPTTGYGAPTFFGGTTFNRTYTDWFAFAATGIIVPKERRDTQFGSNYLYQLGLGRNLSDKNGWIIAGMVEMNGTYAARSTFEGSIDPDSGGNTIFLMPSIWASTKKYIIQLGAGLPVSQHLFGNQNKYTYFLALDFGWTIQ